MGKRTRSSETGERTTRLRSMVIDTASTSSCRQQETDTPQQEETPLDESTPQREEETDMQVSTTPPLEDTINEDGILSSILSFLTLREAVRTSVLSPRWRHIWTNIRWFEFVPATVFDAHTLMHIIGHAPTMIEKYHLLSTKTEQFIGSVNSVLQQLQGATIDGFMVHFSLHKIHSHHLDAWVRFAVASKCKKLCLYLDGILTLSGPKVEFYDFPCHLLRSSSIKSLALTDCSLKQSHQFDGFRHITTLLLYAVDITEENFNHLLSNCSALKMMCVWKFRYFQTLTCSHPLSQLQVLIVEDCDRLTKIEINTANLSKLTYKGVPISFKFGVSSHLEYAEICFDTKSNVLNLSFYLTNLQRSMAHIKSLTFRITGISKVVSLSKTVENFNHLKCLDFTWNVGAKMSYFHLATMLDAAPFLEELKLSLSTNVPQQAPKRLTELVKLIPKHLHTHLRTIEIRDFRCDKWQIEIAIYLLKNSTELESMSIQMCHKSPAKIHEADLKYLLQEIPSKAKLSIF